MTARTPSGPGSRDLASRELDALDLKLLQALELDGRAPFSRIARVLDVSDQTIARRFRRLRAMAGLRVIGMTDDGRLGRDNWILRLGCTPDIAEKLGAALAQRPDTEFIDLASGGTEIMCAMKPRSHRDRDELLLRQLQRTPRITSVSAHCILSSYYGGPSGWLRKVSALDPAEEAALRTPSPAALSGPFVLDLVDEAMLTALRTDGRTPLTELQTVTGQSETVVKRHLDRLRSSGVLYFAVQYDREYLGQAVEAMCWLTVSPRALAEVGAALATHPEVRFAAAVTGRTNVAVSLLTRTTPDLYRYLTDRLAPLPGIQTAETTITLRRLKFLTYDRP
ncbi:AsnC family transcriptional regulator [Actinocorallia herbida]|uniref:AsnC family transcriptional regulator n=1 Tax=Actinocorallia herbida TaxID=58109 RepID=A0A3N1D116_9ACTN|nr:Lrp/AsnC family transcriptional regulator [Actinocorallia herbida]ROO87196.1 AsnC family transcriptional regulator [Actinocorallia herbida]